MADRPTSRNFAKSAAQIRLALRYRDRRADRKVKPDQYGGCAYPKAAPCAGRRGHDLRLVPCLEDLKELQSFIRGRKQFFPSCGYGRGWRSVDEFFDKFSKELTAEIDQLTQKPINWQGKT